MNAPEPRPRVTGWFVEPDEKAVPLLHAMGLVIWAAQALEKSLLLELARLRAERDGQFPPEPELSKLEYLTAGPLLDQLRKLDLPGDLAERISDAIDRRNQLMHRAFEDPEMVAAIARGKGLDTVVSRVERLAIDCGELAVELQLVAGARVEAMLEMPQAEMAQVLASIDLAQISDPRWRAQLEAVRALGDADLSLRPSDSARSDSDGLL
jgi:hypothetical protein